ncbi:hypothetical protein [Paenibacillus sp. NPDC058177]|uniref:hypothetical protein n=1 Tax=Paenibacillus sp. NPDC058177 TaxID=3346369 RepID=UPI0036D8845A
MIIIILTYGISEFIAYFPRQVDRFSKYGQYIMNLSILLTLITTLISQFTTINKNMNIITFAILLIMFFSFTFVKSVLVNFTFFPFLFSNIIFFVLLNIFSFGLIFGFVYFDNNEYFNFYAEAEYNQLNHNFDDKYLYYFMFIIIQKGLAPFYSLSELPLDEAAFDSKGYIVVMPFFEYIVGILFSVCIISFIVSSLVTRTISPGESSEERSIS